MKKGGSDVLPDGWISHVLRPSAKLESRDTVEVDGPKLVAKDETVHRLAGMPARDRNFPRVFRGPSRDRTNGRHA